MARQSKKLTDYEQRQVDQVAAWKAQFPNPFGELFRRVAQPVAKVVEFAIPDRMALGAIEAGYKASDRLANVNDIKLQAGVNEIAELRHQPLEVCDQIAVRVGIVARGVAIAEGALTGAGGVWTTVLDIPLLFALCLRTIIKIGHCYGYPLDRPTDKAWVLAAFAIALSSTRQKRADLIARLHEIEELMVEQTEQQVVVEEAAALITQIEVFEDIPVFGAATGALLNLATAHKSAVTARRLFQERWLRDNGKVNKIEPATLDGKIPSTAGWSGAFARAGYSTLYGLSYAVALPVGIVAAVGSGIAGRFSQTRREEVGNGKPGRRAKDGKRREASLA